MRGMYDIKLMSKLKRHLIFVKNENVHKCTMQTETNIRSCICKRICSDLTQIKIKNTCTSGCKHVKYKIDQEIVKIGLLLATRKQIGTG